MLDRMLYADSLVRLPDHPVMILDRMTMAHGLEARARYLWIMNWRNSRRVCQ